MSQAVRLKEDSFEELKGIDAGGIFGEWLGNFAAAVEAGSGEQIAAQFVPDGFWRDLVAFSWEFRTWSGRDEITAGFAETLPTVRPHGVRIAADRMAPRTTKYLGRPVVEGYVDFETAVGHGTAYVRLRLPEGSEERSERPLAWVVLTTLQSLTGHEEQLGTRRPTGTEFSWEFGGDNWLDLRTKEIQYSDRNPQVLIIGGGQGGLILGARLKQFGVDALIVEKHPRIGDNWRTRYHSLTLHNEVWSNSLPYIPFPPTWPTFLPKDKLAGWLEYYAEAMELNVWTGTELLGSSFDSGTKKWTVDVKRADGTVRTLVVPHLVFATGGVNGRPKMPSMPGLEDFEGEVVHSSGFSSGTAYSGKKAIVVGAGNSAHDVAQDLHANGAAEVTMIQRGPTTVVSLLPSGILVYSLYRTGPVEDIDMITAANPYDLLVQSYQWLTKRTCGYDRELLDGLEKAGFKLGFGHDETGFHMQYLRRAGGYYINVGCSELIIDGKIRVVQDQDVEGFERNELLLSGGEKLEADLVVMATGYENMQGQIRSFCGDEVADRVGPVWGWDDQGFMRNMWRRTPQDGLWVMGGGLNECRLYSRFLAVLITAELEGLLPARGGVMDRPVEWDVLVIGSGIGGLAAAAMLAHHGKKVLVVETHERVGGRGSTVEIDGFKVSTGAVALELGGPMEDLFRTVNARYDVRRPNEPAQCVQFRGRTFNTTSRPARLLIDGGLRRLGKRLTRKWDGPPQGDDPSFEQWLSRFPVGKTLRRLGRNIAAGVFSVNSDEVSARAMLTYVTQKSLFRDYGFPPAGTIGPMLELAAVVERRGGQVWLSSSVESLDITGGLVRSATVRRGDETVTVTCGAVVSNAGPSATIALCGDGALSAEYVALVKDKIHPAPMYAVTFASRRRLANPAGIVFFADTTRLSAVAHLTSACPEVAPPGWYLYVAYAVPVPAMSPFDEDAERAAILAELAQELDGFEQARILGAPLLSGDWPAQRVVAGSEIDSATPVANLWNVGDATRAYGDGGLQGCATNGREVSGRVLSWMASTTDVSYGG